MNMLDANNVRPQHTWGYIADRDYPMVAAAVVALRRDGIRLVELACDRSAKYCRWSQAIAKCVSAGECRGGVVFCEDPGLVCCVANKVPGVRAAGVTTVCQAARATLALGANLLAVEMPGRTYFEVRQILRTLCAAACACPAGTADTLRELDGHAHR
jgi:ribose 5-phosphate isomerase RpiB